MGISTLLLTSSTKYKKIWDEVAVIIVVGPMEPSGSGYSKTPEADALKTPVSK